MEMREFRDTMQDALNRANVHPGEEFEIVGITDGIRPRIRVTERNERQTAFDPEEAEPVAPTEALLFEE